MEIYKKGVLTAEFVSDGLARLRHTAHPDEPDAVNMQIDATWVWGAHDLLELSAYLLLLAQEVKAMEVAKT